MLCKQQRDRRSFEIQTIINIIHDFIGIILAHLLTGSKIIEDLLTQHGNVSSLMLGVGQTGAQNSNIWKSGCKLFFGVSTWQKEV